MPVSHHSTVIAQDLDLVFSVPQMARAWKKTVRTGLRRQPLADLHDFLDVHRSLRPYLRALRSEVLSGQYRPLPPETTLLEKRDGIPRRLVLPAAADAILLQTIVSALEKEIAAGQVHPNAYYSQSHAPPSPEDIDGTFAYPWWILWPHFQQRIWRFTRTYDYVVITDVANYFDCIPLAALRNRIASLAEFSETVLNFLFFLLDAFTWRPYYMPAPGVGLPQLNFDAPRLLAHAYLFPIDTELQVRTGGDFVRWMDDINCGVPDPETAHTLLRGLEIVLNSLGLRLNPAKTEILEAKEALAHFWVGENQVITVLTNLVNAAVKGSSTWKRHRGYAVRRHKRFRRQRRLGQWEKVYKRYFTLFGLLDDAGLQTQVPNLLRNVPGLRGAICRYYALLGPSKLRLQHLERYLRSGCCLDDASLFEVVRTFISWRGQLNGARRDTIIALVPIAVRLGSEQRTFSPMTVAGVSSAVWILAKYGRPAELAGFLTTSSTVWTRSSWAARQVAAATPLLPNTERNDVQRMIVQSGLMEAVRVLASIDELANLKTIDPQLRKYLLHPPSKRHPYPLEKAVIARVVLLGALNPAERKVLRKRLNQFVNDPSYAWIIRRKQ